MFSKLVTVGQNVVSAACCFELFIASLQSDPPIPVDVMMNIPSGITEKLIWNSFVGSLLGKRRAWSSGVGLADRQGHLGPAGEKHLADK